MCGIQVAIAYSGQVQLVYRPHLPWNNYQEGSIIRRAFALGSKKMSLTTCWKHISLSPSVPSSTQKTALNTSVKWNPALAKNILDKFYSPKGAFDQNSRDLLEGTLVATVLSSPGKIWQTPRGSRSKREQQCNMYRRNSHGEE